jgi:hypothetical protein
VDLIDFLNQNSGAIVAVTASLSAVFTVLLLVDARATRNLRREANVVGQVRLHGEVGMQLEFRVTNFGPAQARDVAMAFSFRNADGEVQGGRKQREPLLAPGEDRRFLPSPGEALMDLTTLAGYALILDIAWSWRDDRRRLWFLARTHRRRESHVTEDLRQGMYGGWALTRRDTAEDLHDVADHLREIRRVMKEVRSDQQFERMRQKQVPRPAAATPDEGRSVGSPTVTAAAAELLAALASRVRRDKKAD